MIPSLYVAAFGGSMVFGAMLAAAIVAWRNRSARQDELRYGRMRPSSTERLFRAPPILETWDAPYPAPSESFPGFRNATR
jgi:hypothetical protein